MTVSAPKYTQPYVHKYITRDMRFIQKHSSEVALDQGILSFIIINREYPPHPYEGWASFPATWFAEHSKMGRRRVGAALKRLEEWGIIKGMSTNNSKQMSLAGYAPRYRYDLRDYSASVKAETASHTRSRDEQVTKRSQALSPKGQGELTTIIPQSPPVATVPRSLPKAGPDGAYNEVWILDKGTQRMVPTQVAPSDFVCYPICKACHRAFHPTEGTAGEYAGDTLSPPRTGFCSDCYTIAVVKFAVEATTMVSCNVYTPAGGNLDLKTRDEMREYLTSRDITWVPNSRETARG